MKELVWLIPLLPFAGALLNGVLLKGRIGKRAVGAIACGAVLASLVLGIGAGIDYLGGPEHAAHRPFEQVLYTWIPAGPLEVVGGPADLSFEMGFLLDPLSVVMVLVVGFVGFLIHVYSIGYMGGDPGYQRYFAYLNLFMGAMLLLVLANNYLAMFVGWEGVGLCSYLLIGFYFNQEFPPYAGRKAFIVNRIGDAGFLVGLFALVSTFGTLSFSELFGRIGADPSLARSEFLGGMSVAGFVTLCLFLGAVGKSAQIPLFVWLPDAMAGPTPVSALIHAATMVTAGVYMVVRSNVLYQLAPETSAVVAGVGAATALFAATIGLAQTDIKKVLAYSTVSQLGYMFLAAGVGAYTAAIFHLGTHAFFKALLFLGAGSVIHALGGEQDLRRMGGLRRRLPVTFWTFLVAALALSGFPPFAGFFSKDEILHQAFVGGHYLLYGAGLLTAGLTACYMFRAVYLAFGGTFRGSEEAEGHLHESPPMMAWPLRILAVGALAAGWVGIPLALTFHRFDWNVFDRLLEPVLVDIPGLAAPRHEVGLGLEWALIALSVAVAAAGFLVARGVYGRGRGLAAGEEIAGRFPPLHRLLVNKYYVDELYDATVVRGTWGATRVLNRFDQGVIDGFFVNGTRHVTVAASLLSGFFDKYVVDGLVNLSGWTMSFCSRLFRRLQTGLVSQYALVFAVGMFVLVCFYILARAR